MLPPLMRPPRSSPFLADHGRPRPSHPLRRAPAPGRPGAHRAGLRLPPVGVLLLPRSGSPAVACCYHQGGHGHQDNAHPFHPSPRPRRCRGGSHRRGGPAWRTSLGRTIVDQRLYEGYTVPLGQRSASPGLRTAGCGTRLPLPEGETIRFFLHWRDLAVGEHQVANLDHSSNRALAHLLDLLEGRRMPLAHLLGLLADDVVEDPDKAQLVFRRGRDPAVADRAAPSAAGPRESHGGRDLRSGRGAPRTGRRGNTGQCPAMRVLPSAFSQHPALSLSGHGRAGSSVTPPGRCVRVRRW